MLSKQELIGLLEESLKGAIPLYTKHVSSTLFLSKMPKEKKLRINDILQELHTQSSGHAITYKQMINDIQGDNRNVY
jgi:hypothetical protein